MYEAALYPEAEYTFKHPLTQEVAYHTQLGDRRARLHGAVAGAIQTLYPDKLDERAAVIAHHVEQSGEALDAARWHARAEVVFGIVSEADAGITRVDECERAEVPGATRQGLSFAENARGLFLRDPA
ncbi:MAG TPA: hypothetical protein VLF14_10075 [Candidatus Binatia bacterium]|nr:hypothetical protein [Candidatus Binatia bacterium]